MRNLERRLTELEQRIAPQSEAVTVFVHGAVRSEDGQIVEDDSPPLVLRIEPQHVQRQRFRPPS
ncbi:MAG: hypothetical protein KGL51_00470 [Betaproteobacteria bacterium]|nr:hypothetical protein [Betaproteobacteria bacterium]MDE2123591.1 hypothetical protein [Betaproteobacteria bacterium]MDE2186143.1 hypothetical protein [Betaproteobacteria bacterium]MDE2323140.1 hypothetical protein [Betaproteobacteria bacterium]